MSDQNTQYTRQLLLSLLPTLMYAAVLPYLIYRLASPHMPATSALLLAAIPPAVGTLIGLIRQGRLNLLGMLSLLGIAVKLISGLIFKEPRLLLISDSLMTGVYGIIMLVSLLFGRPLLLTLARNALAGAPAAQREQLERRWLEAGRSFFTLITAVWGTGLFLVLVVSVALAYTLTIQQFVLIGPIVQYSMFGVLLLGTQLYSRIRRYRKSKMLEKAQQQKRETPSASM